MQQNSEHSQIKCQVHIPAISYYYINTAEITCVGYIISLSGHSVACQCLVFLRSPSSYLHFIMAESKAYKLLLTEEQKEAIEIFCTMNEWNIQMEQIEDASGGHAETNKDQNVVTTGTGATPTATIARHAPRVDVWCVPNAVECCYCFLRPCVTTHRQAWLGQGRAARLANRVTRKTLYKKFWSVMEYRGAWNDPRYMEKKAIAVQQADNQEIIVWTTGPKARESVREIMPECILKLVRSLYPNPPGVSYMGHKWH